MFGISFEHLIILAIILIIFGPKRLPELGNTLGKAIRNFKDGIQGVENADFRRINTPPPAAPLNAPLADAPPNAAPGVAPGSTITSGASPSKSEDPSNKT